ncbi:MAG: flagellar motor protein MotB [Planctomycetota bacterium]|nr:flagellar motor protein MotB [Planctomycetota bacterium]
MLHKPIPKDEGGEIGSPLWMVSFTDAMTNLLTFFILLVTFSAFGDDAPSSGGLGILSLSANPALHEANFKSRTSMLPDAGAVRRPVSQGSEKPNPTVEAERGGKPRAPIGILDTEAYHDRKVIYLPSKYLFYGWGKFITEVGQTRLTQLAPFLRETSCQISIGESSLLHPNHPLFARPNLGPERAWAIVEYFTEKEHLPLSRFTIAPRVSTTRPDLSEEPVVEIVLQTRRVYP